METKQVMEGSQLMDALRQVCTCRVCGYVWIVSGELPKRCAGQKCRSLLWNREAKPNGGQLRARKQVAGGQETEEPFVAPWEA